MAHVGYKANSDVCDTAAILDVAQIVNWMLCDYFDTTTIKLPELDDFVTFHSDSSSSKMSSTLGRRQHHYTSESGNQTGVADLYAVYTIILRRCKISSIFRTLA